jgi:5-methylcytosine-specific restriction endonuclease McrA
MMGLAEPPHRWDAETTTAAALQTLRPAVDPITGSMVKADVTRLEPSHGSKDGCVVSPRQGVSCAERVRSLMESGMSDSVTDLLAACRAMPANDPVDIELCVSAYRGKHKSLRRRYFRRRFAVWSLTGGRCLYCRRLVDFSGVGCFHVDHVIPRADGGTDDFGNLVPACDACNAAKGALSLNEWMAAS